MMSAYEEAWQEYDSLKSFEEYLFWKSNNFEKWKFEEEEAFFHLPIIRDCDAYAVNIEGKVYINDKLHELRNANDSFYKSINKTTL